VLSLHTAMRGAPTTRRFAPDPIDRDALHRALDHARFAPSAGNRQPWRVVVLTDAATRRAIRDLYLPHWNAYLDETGTAALVDRVPVLREADAFARALERVPVHLVIAGETALMHTVDDGLGRPPVTGGASVYPFVQNLLLALRAEDLGAAFATLLARAEPAVKELLAIPDGVQVCGLVAVGRRATPWPRALARAPVAAFAHAERWGASFEARREADGAGADGAARR
jgi:nitroreductase